MFFFWKLNLEEVRFISSVKVRQTSKTRILISMPAIL